MNTANSDNTSSAATDESDDLIAELARIVAKDAHAARRDVPTRTVELPPIPATREPPPAPRPAGNPDDILSEGFHSIGEPKLPTPPLRQAPPVTAEQAGPAGPRPLRPADLGFERPAAPTGRPEASQGLPPELSSGGQAPSGDQGQPKGPPQGAIEPMDDPLADPIADLIAASEAAELENVNQPAPPAMEETEPVRPPQPDRFATSPAMREARPAPPRAGTTDPLDEIERLIAETTAIDFPPPPPDTEPESTPTDTEPRPHGSTPPVRPLDDAAAAAEAAISASVTASMNGAEEDEPGAQAAAAAFTRGLGRFIVPATAGLALIALAGGGAWWYFTQNGSLFGDVPVVTAQNAAIKEAAPEPDTAPNDSIVFNQLAGDDTSTPADEQIVSRDETAGETGEGLARVITPDSDTGGLANRKVRTVTVRADGTIVAGDEATAGIEPLPALRPNVPDVPGAPEIEAGDADSIGAVLNALAEEDPGLLTNVPGTTDPVAAAIQPETVQASASAPPAGAGNVAPVPIPRPNQTVAASPPPASQPAPQVNVGVVENRIATAPAADPNAPVSLTGGTTPTRITTSPSTAPYYVQLSSQRSEEAARATVSDLERQFGGVLGTVRLAIQRVDLGDRGVFFRVKAPAGSSADANALCNQIKVAGGDCFVRTD